MTDPKNQMPGGRGGLLARTNSKRPGSMGLRKAGDCEAMLGICRVEGDDGLHKQKPEDGQKKYEKGEKKQ